MAYRCEACGANAGKVGIRCNPCAAQQLRTCLRSPIWMEYRGCTPGDLPGENLADTFRRELSTLTN